MERKKIKAAFGLFDRDNKSVVVKEEIGTIMRYLGAYPTEEELVTDILPQIQDDEETQYVKYDRFESFMVRVLVEKNYEPDTEEVKTPSTAHFCSRRCTSTLSELSMMQIIVSHALLLFTDFQFGRSFCKLLKF
jgi:hypothetical protein